MERSTGRRRAPEDRLDLDFERDPEVLALMGGPLGLGVFTLDANGAVVGWSAGAERITGLSRREVVGRGIDVLEGPGCEGFRELGDLMAPSAPNGAAIENRVLVLRVRSGVRRVVANARALRDANGAVYGAIAVFSDVTAAFGGGTPEELAAGDSGLPGFVGRSQAMLEVYRRVRLAADSDVTTLVTGESGTGKELAARAIHDLSERRRGPFVAINCSAMPESLLESELFGHVKGAFTDAVRDRVGAFESANGGTLFLDEIGEIPPFVQVKLLRALQEREIRRVGGSEVVPVDIRLVAATNRDLERRVAEGAMREDFYYRIRVFEVHLPPLRDRAADVPLLARHFLARACEKQGRASVDLDQDAVAALVRHPWPGNVRELRNAVEHALVVQRGARIGVDDLPATVRERRPAPGTAPGLTPHEEAEKLAILDALDATGWNRTRAAELLHISRVTLWKRIRLYGIDQGIFRRGTRDV
ncbi:MAG: sigma 54-interacting transcriptional regulator [Planctomycetota bacterium]